MGAGTIFPSPCGEEEKVVKSSRTPYLRGSQYGLGMLRSWDLFQDVRDPAMPVPLETRQSIHKAIKRPRSGPIDSVLVWRVVLAICLSTCAFTALYYEVRGIFKIPFFQPEKNSTSSCIQLRALPVVQAASGRGAIQGQMVFLPSSPRHTSCSYGVPEKDHQTFCCTGRAGRLIPHSYTGAYLDTGAMYIKCMLPSCRRL